MTTEDAFQGCLDAHPDDHTCRLVFADWLEERGDPRAEGYRALGRRRNVPFGQPIGGGGYRWAWTGCTEAVRRPHHRHWLTADWDAQVRVQPDTGWHPSRRAAEDAAALAFARLPPERRAELLGAGRAAAT